MNTLRVLPLSSTTSPPFDEILLDRALLRTGTALSWTGTLGEGLAAWAVVGAPSKSGCQRPDGMNVWQSPWFESADPAGEAVLVGSIDGPDWTQRATQPWSLETFSEDALALFALFERAHEAGLRLVHGSPFGLHLTEDGWRWTAHPGGLEAEAPLPSCAGLPGFMAPEAALAEAKATISNDLWLLGALLWLRATGYLPPVSARFGGAPICPPRHLRAELPPGLTHTIERLVTPWIDGRPKTLEEAADGLREDLRFAHERSTLPKRVLEATTTAETHVGITKRQRMPINQDAVLVRVSERHDMRLLVVADGVSTAQWGSGDRASAEAVAAFDRRWHADLVELAKMKAHELEAWMRDCIAEANASILDAVNAMGAPFETPPSDVMGSTVVAALVRGGEVTIVQLGDSAALLIRAGDRYESLCREHNVRLEYLLAGRGADEAMDHPAAFALTRCLGLFYRTPDGMLSPEQLTPDTLHLYLQEGDTLLLASDGLLDFAGGGEVPSSAVIGAIMEDEPDLALAALELILAANRGGGGDNVSVILHRVDTAEPLTGVLHRMPTLPPQRIEGIAPTGPPSGPHPVHIHRIRSSRSPSSCPERERRPRTLRRCPRRPRRQRR